MDRQDVALSENVGEPVSSYRHGLTPKEETGL